MVLERLSSEQLRQVPSEISPEGRRLLSFKLVLQHKIGNWHCF